MKKKVLIFYYLKEKKINNKLPDDSLFLDAICLLASSDSLCIRLPSI
jgi:hypothetical protein